MDPELDEVIAAATERTREAEDRFLETPPAAPDLVPKAEAVEQRAEEVEVLSGEAADEAGRAEADRKG